MSLFDRKGVGWKKKTPSEILEEHRLAEAIKRGDKMPPPENKCHGSYEEQQIQISCVKWFRMQYKSIGNLLFSIPNGYAKSKAAAGLAKAEGLTAGVADLCLAIPRGGYGALYIEMKQKGNYQQPNQKEWQRLTESVGNKYVVVRSIEEFMIAVNSYLKLPVMRPNQS